MSDLWWALAAPVYLLLGVLRHELSHVVGGLYEGGMIKDIQIFPGYHEGVFYWGRVTYFYEMGWLATAAPYICDLLTFVLTLVICVKCSFVRRWRVRYTPTGKHGFCERFRTDYHWVWVNLFILGMISPLINTLYNVRWFFANLLYGFPGGFYANDVGYLAGLIGVRAVCFYFAATILFYSCTIVYLVLNSQPKAVSSFD